MQHLIDKSKKPVIVTFIVLMIITLVDALSTSNEFGLANMILEHLLVPIIILSTLMSAYWILLTDDFWLVYEGSDTSFWTKVKTAFKFIVWIPGMALYFFAVTQALLSIYNRTAGEQQLTVISGLIIDKDQHRSRHYVEIQDQSLGRSVEIRVNESEYNRLNPGDTYRTERKLGALGLFYEGK